MPDRDSHSSRKNLHPSHDTLEYAQALLDKTREELVRADSKAALLLAASGVAIGALLNGLIGAKWSPLQLSRDTSWLWWLGVTAASIAVASLAAAIFPATKRSGDKPTLIAYYGDVVTLGRDELEKQLSVTPAKLYSALLDQIYATSCIADRKYKLLRVAILSFGFAATGCASSVIVDLVIR